MQAVHSRRACHSSLCQIDVINIDTNIGGDYNATFDAADVTPGSVFTGGASAPASDYGSSSSLSLQQVAAVDTRDRVASGDVQLTAGSWALGGMAVDTRVVGAAIGGSRIWAVQERLVVGGVTAVRLLGIQVTVRLG